MSDDDPQTIEHERYEQSPKDRRSDKWPFIVFGALTVFVWGSSWYLDGWQFFDWFQIALGAMTMAAILGPIVHYVDLKKPYRDCFK